MARFFRLVGVLTILGIICSLGLVSQAVHGQIRLEAEIKDAPTKGLPPAFSSQVSLPTNRDLAVRLEAAHDYIESGGWRQVTQVLQDILDHPQDCFMPIRRPGPGGKEQIVWVSVRAEANRLLGAMPAKGLEVYEVVSGARAATLLQAAKKDGNPERLAEVAQRYFHTRAGTEACDLLGTHHLDRGQYLMAASCFGRLLQRADVSAVTLFKASLAFRKSGDDTAATAAWKRLAAKAADGLALGERRVPLGELKKALDRQPQSARAKAGSLDWPMFRGDFTRAGLGVGHKPILESKWEKPTVHEGTSKGWIEGAAQQLQARGHAILPGFFPITVAGKVIYRSHRGIHAVDHASGELAWESVLNGGFDNPVHLDSSADIHDKLSSWVATYLQSPHILVENSTIGTLSSDGTRVFAVEDLGVPPYPFGQYYGRGMIVRGGIGLAPATGAQTGRDFNHNHLVAVNIESGSMLWAQGGDRGTLQETVFLGPPLPLSGKLYSLVEKDQELRLVCLEPRTGKLAWTQTLANFKKGIDQDIARRTWAAHPAYAEGILICPSNSGAVVAVDLLSHSLLWAHAYAQAAPPPVQKMNLPGGRIRLVNMGNPYVPRLDCNWKNSAPLIVDGKVLLTAPDATALQCLNLRDGSLLWQAEWNSDDCYLAGAFRGKVVTVGKQVCRAFNLADGKPLWIAPTGMPSGQGVAAGKLYYLPLRSTSSGPAIVGLDMDTGNIANMTVAPKNQVLGNLLFYHGRLLSQTATTVTAYPVAKD